MKAIQKRRDAIKVHILRYEGILKTITESKAKENNSPD